MTGLLKNPVCDDLVYAEPVDSVHKPSTGLIGKLAPIRSTLG